MLFEESVEYDEEGGVLNPGTGNEVQDHLDHRKELAAPSVADLVKRKVAGPITLAADIIELMQPKVEIREIGGRRETSFYESHY